MQRKYDRAPRKFEGNCSRYSNLSVERKENESSERLIKRFMRKLKKLKIEEGVKEREYYEKPSVVRNRKKRRRESVLRKLKAENQ